MHIIYRQFKKLADILTGQHLFIKPNYQCTHNRFGSEYGGWEIIETYLHKKSIVYSFGIGTDISFDLTLIHKFSLTIYAFDPTPKSIQWIYEQTLPKQFIMHNYGIADFNGAAVFYPPSNPNYISHTMLNKEDTKEQAIQVPVKTLKTILQTLNHQHIDILKMDIEGAEYSVIDDIKSTNIRPKQLLIEFHHRFPNIGVKKTKKAIKAIKAMGYKLFYISPSKEEYSFILT